LQRGEVAGQGAGVVLLATQLLLNLLSRGEGNFPV
jgi:hypothetical protein